MTAARLLLLALLGGVLLGIADASCGRCNNIHVSLECQDDWYAYPLPQTGALACEVITGAINLDCKVDGLLYPTVPTSYTFKTGTSDVADFSTISRPDPTNGTLVLGSVSASAVYYCVANVKDANGDSHELRSNTVIIKKVSADDSDLRTPSSSATTVAMSDFKSYVTELMCNGGADLPSDWYPLPTFSWQKDDKALTKTNRKFSINFDVGKYKRGSLLIHGFSSADDIGTYKCTVHYYDWESYVKAVKAQYDAEVAKDPNSLMDVPPSSYKLTHPQDMWQYMKNKTTSKYTLQDDSDSVENTFISTYDQAVKYQNLDKFVAWREIITLQAYAIGGPIGNVTSDIRATYSWSLTGPESGLLILNDTCVAEHGVGGDERDFYNYPMCVYVGTSTTDRTLDLDDEDNLRTLGMEMSGPSNNMITLPFSYGIDKSTITVTITYAESTSYSLASVNKTATYSGENVVFGFAPPSENNTCAYNSKATTLPLSEVFYQKFITPMITPLADYDLMSSCLYQNSLVSGFRSTEAETFTLNDGIQTSAADKCQYYQVTRRNERSDKLWSYMYQTVLVETLGNQGSNSDYSSSDWDKPTISWSNESLTDMVHMTVTCTAENGDGKGSIAFIDVPYDCASGRTGEPCVEKINGAEDSSDCSYNASVKIDMTKLDEPCPLMCGAKSQCTELKIDTLVVEPIKCPLPVLGNGTFYVEEGAELATTDVLYGTKIKPKCADGFQREGPDEAICQEDRTFGGVKFECVDLNVVTCTTLNPLFGTMDCDTTKNPVECTYHCPTSTYFESGDSLVSSKTVTCDSSTARWSHMSESNPLGTFSRCSVTDTATYIILKATLGFTGASSCPNSSAIITGLKTVFQSSSKAGYSCMKSTCDITEASCSVSDSALSVVFYVNQTGGDLSTDSTLTSFVTQLKTDAKSSLSLTISSKKRRKRSDVSLSANGDVDSSLEATCADGSGTVAGKCLKCPAGTYESDGSCEECSKGTYNAVAGSTSCTACSGSLTTITTGADSSTDCIVECTVSSVTNGIKSPSVGYTVAEGTVVSTFCSTDYSVESGAAIAAECKNTQPVCQKMCAVKKVDGNANTTLATGSSLAYKATVNYTCSNDEGGDFAAECKDAGADVSVSCPSLTGLIVGLVFGIIFIILIVLVSLRIYHIKSRPESVTEMYDVAEPSPDSIIGFIKGRMENFSSSQPTFHRTPPAPPPLPARRAKTPPPPPAEEPSMKSKMLSVPGDAIGRVGTSLGDQMKRISLV